MSELYVFRSLESQPWWRALAALQRALRRVERSGRQARATDLVTSRYAQLVAALVSGGHASLPRAAATALLEGEPVLARRSGELPNGLREAAVLDLELVQERIDCEWQGLAEAAAGKELPPLIELAAPDMASAGVHSGEAEEWARRLAAEEPAELLAALLRRYGESGTGLLARHPAFRWRGDRLEGIARPARDRLEELVGLDNQLERLCGNVERFLDSKPALHTLLYGPRGSGKSTAVRGLLTRYGDRRLRLVEVAPDALFGLPQLSDRLREAPYRFLIYVDDLSFEGNDAGYQPLKSLLEGSVGERPENVLLVATSNRRHLVRESFSDRPMPESDDVHAWDTTNERLALADRFGLTITFPAADQRKYLAMVRELARNKGVTPLNGELDEAAIKFADWGNGYSGRTARQFVDTL